MRLPEGAHVRARIDPNQGEAPIGPGSWQEVLEVDPAFTNVPRTPNGGSDFRTKAGDRHGSQVGNEGPVTRLARRGGISTTDVPVAQQVAQLGREGAVDHAPATPRRRRHWSRQQRVAHLDAPEAF